MSRTLALAILALTLTACASTRGGSQFGADMSEEEIERYAYQRTGDVRIYYYVKPAYTTTRDGRREQRRQLYILANKDHAFYRGVPDSHMRDGEYFLYNADMHDVLLVLRNELGFFSRGAAVNILDQDPLQRADRESPVTRIIAVEQIRDGQVNTSYFSIRYNETDSRRIERFSRCQELILNVIGNALPRGSAGHGEGDRDLLGRNR